MNSEPVYIGMDICKTTLDLSKDLGGKQRQFEQSKKGYRQLIDRLQGPVHVVCEATGGYERAVVQALHEASIKVSVINPSRVRDFAKSDGLLAKTDPLDAELLARFGKSKNPAPTAPSSAQQQELEDLMLRRQQLKDMITAETNRLHQCVHPFSRRQLQKHLNYLQKQVKELDAATQNRIEKSPELNRRVCKLCETVGVGNVTAWRLLAYLPELGTVNRRRISHLAGVAPMNNDSGPNVGHRFIRGGRAEARTTLYMSALGAAFKHPQLKDLYKRLVAAGKPKKVALTAVMRRLIISLNTALKQPLETSA